MGIPENQRSIQKEEKEEGGRRIKILKGLKRGSSFLSLNE